MLIIKMNPYKHSPVSLSNTMRFPSPQPAIVRLYTVSKVKTASEVSNCPKILNPDKTSMTLIVLSALPVKTSKFV